MNALTPTRVATQLLLVTASAWLLSGCASTPPPKEKMAVAEAAIQRASNSNTTDHAPGQLQVAVSKLAAARVAMAAKDYGRAGQLAEQVEVDAQVAELHAQATRTDKSAKETQDAERALREEITRKTPK